VYCSVYSLVRCMHTETNNNDWEPMYIILFCMNLIVNIIIERLETIHDCLVKCSEVKVEVIVRYTNVCTKVSDWTITKETCAPIVAVAILFRRRRTFRYEQQQKTVKWQVKIITLLLMKKNSSTGITDRLGDNDFQTNVLHTINYLRTQANTHGRGIDE